MQPWSDSASFRSRHDELTAKRGLARVRARLCPSPASQPMPSRAAQRCASPSLPVLSVSSLRGHCQTRGREASFSSKSFTVSGSTFKSLMHFELIPAPAVGEGPTSTPLHEHTQFPKHHLSSFSHRMVLSRVLGIAQLTRARVFSWGFASLPLVSVRVRPPASLFLKMGFAIRAPLRVRINVRMGFSISTKNCHWDFDRSRIEFADHSDVKFSGPRTRTTVR